MGQLQLLYQLQQIDTEIREKKQRLSEVLQAQGETEALLVARSRAESAAQALRKWQTENQKLNLELESLVAKAKRSEQRLYSGNVKNPKELADLQQGIEALGRRRSALEDEILEVMIMVEEAQAEKDAADEALATIEKEWAESQAQLKQEQQELALRLHTLMGMREKHLPMIAAEVLADYEDISRQRGGLAVVSLTGNMCLGCRLNVAENRVKAAREGQLVHCNSCGRILYL
ncbi:MAG: zinc ribbon domain-containing protein [Anaerolineae bacterium]